MGQGAVIGTFAIVITVALFMYSAQLTSLETQEAQTESHASETARDLAMKGRKLVLARWLESAGALHATPFDSVSLSEGTVYVTDFNASDNMLDVTVRGVSAGAVHDVRSRYLWQDYELNPFQVKATSMDVYISPLATLGISTISIDDQSLTEIEDVLINDLKLSGSLAELDLGINDMADNLIHELQISGHTDIAINIIDAQDRSYFEQVNGMFFPDQVMQLVDNYISLNPSKETVINDVLSLPQTFGLSSGDGLLRVKDNLTIGDTLSGKGILIVEGDLIVNESGLLDWEGLILVQPPAENTNPKIDFGGTVDINGGFVVVHEGVPNTGHIDFTIMYDPSHQWLRGEGQVYPWWRHTHDFSGKKGNQVGFYSNQSGFTLHKNESRFYQLLNLVSPSSDLFLELYNVDNHGRAILSMKLAGRSMGSAPVASGFAPEVADPQNPYRTVLFNKSDIEHLDIDVTRISALRKMWDSKEEYPGCQDPSRKNDGPRCVATGHDRYGAFTLRLYEVTGSNELRWYDAALYWHRRLDEQDQFEQEMNDLLSHIKSPDYGLDIDFGDDFTFTANNDALSTLSSMTQGAPSGFTHTGTWHSHWTPDHPANPLKKDP